MKLKKNTILILLTISIIALSINFVSAADMNTTSSGTVSGGVDISSSNPWNTTGEVNYTIPENTKNITSAQVIVNVYSGSATPTYGAQANVSLNTGNGYKQIANENLTSTQGSTDGTIYTINNHTTKVYSDYEMTYDITNQVNQLSAGDTFSINVATSQMTGYSFDGRIKAITLIVTYNDNDSDIINYWINSGQQWSNQTTNTIFSTFKTTGDIDNVTLTDISLSSGVAKYELNGNILSDPQTTSGNYYNKNIWDVTKYYNETQNTTLTYTGAVSSYSGKISFKNILAVLTVSQSHDYKINATIKPEYSSGSGAVYAGVNNTLKINITNGDNTVNNLKVELYDGDKLVASQSIDLNNNESKIIKITDPTIRDITTNTELGNNNTKINYTVKLIKNDKSINQTSTSYPLLYNGYLGKDYEFPESNITTTRIYNINGNILIYNLNESTYASASITQRTDVWNLNLTNINPVEALIYVSYNWDKTTNSTYPILNTSFNNKIISPIANYRDQSNLGNYGKLGYGVIVYNVTDLLSSGNNNFTIIKTANLTALYPSSLVLIYNETGSKTNKTVYINEGADLLSTSYNTLPRETVSINQFDLTSNVKNATWYVFAANNVADKCNLIFNNQTFNNIYNGSSKTVGVYTADVTNSISKNNIAKFNATGSTILALQQILVVENTAKSNISTVLTLNDFSEVYGAGQNLTGKLTNLNGDPIIGQKIALNLTHFSDGASKIYWATSDTKGEFQLEINLYPGKYSASATYNGFISKDNITYSPAGPVNASLIVTSEPTPVDNRTGTILTVRNYTGVYGAPKNLTGNLKTINGVKLIGQKTPLNLTRLSDGASKIYWVTIDTDGEFQLEINLYPGKYSVSSTYPGNTQYKPSESGLTSLVVTKA